MATEQESFRMQAFEEELERIHLEISATRRRREQVVADFERFLRENQAAMERQSRVPLPAAAEPGARGQSSQPSHVDFGVFDEPGPALDDRAAWPPAWLQRVPPSATVAGLLALAVLAYVLIPGRRDAGTPPTSEAQPDTAVTASSGTVPGPTEEVAGGTSGPGSAVPRAVQAELVTVEDVWMRVHVDGERVIERVVPAGQRLHYSADREIVLRAGNAGAVLVVTPDGGEQPLGRAGVAVTRSFTPQVP